MESSTHRTEEEKKRRDEIKRQIAFLQAKLDLDDTTPGDDGGGARPSHAVQPHSPKRKKQIDASRMLVPPTPSPKKRKLNDGRAARKSGSLAKYDAGKPSIPALKLPQVYGSGKPESAKEPQLQTARPAPSNVLDRLAKLDGRLAGPSLPTSTVNRSSGFEETPSEALRSKLLGSTRDGDLAIVQELQIGPVDHVAPTDDPQFMQLEPNSGIRLSSRTVPHEDLQEHLRGRFYLSPSMLYSTIRPLPNKQAYDVPVEGDWVTIAVVAERGPVKFTKAPVAAGPDDGDGDTKDGKKWKGKDRNKEEPPKPTGKRYVNFKLIDFGARSRSSSSTTGGQAIIRGDAFLSLLLFEADRFDLETSEGEKRPRKIYRGGSRGAFESMAKLKEGDVIALLNPRVLKPFQRSNDKPHPTSNILAVTPESATSIMVIGRSRDLGMCIARKRDGSVCGSWTDKRVSDVCEWHIQTAVERRKASRPEFSVGTMGMSTVAAPKRKPEYDPIRRLGLKPEDSHGGTDSTYFISGHIIGGSNVDSRSLWVTENMGREGQAKATRKFANKDADKLLKSLLDRDKEGMRAVMTARKAAKKDRSSKKAEENADTGESDSDENAPQVTQGTVKNAYSAQMIKNLGFNPAFKTGMQRQSHLDTQKKLDDLVAARAARGDVNLGRKPGPKILSNVIVPIQEAKDTEVMVDLDDI